MEKTLEPEVQAQEQSWWKRNGKKVLIGGGIIIAAVVGSYFGFKYRGAICEYSNAAAKALSDHVLGLMNRAGKATNSAASTARGKTTSAIPNGSASAVTHEAVSKFCPSVKPDEGLAEAVGEIAQAVISETPPDSCTIIMVPEYLRRLPEGYNASIRARMFAAALGLELPEGKTFVSGYTYPKCY